MGYFLPKKIDIALKRTLNWNRSAEKMGYFGAGDFDAIEPMTNRLQEIQAVQLEVNAVVLIRIVSDEVKHCCVSVNY
uniref:Uncharacterized protein n=1 Tax=Tolypothrix bouteillei VB521301 TaxID=1479485 RepID=A0A0C1N6S6_9CYAN